MQKLTLMNSSLPADQRIPGYVTGYVRRFWQVSASNPNALGDYDSISRFDQLTRNHSGKVSKATFFLSPILSRKAGMLRSMIICEYGKMAYVCNQVVQKTKLGKH